MKRRLRRWRALRRLRARQQGAVERRTSMFDPRPTRQTIPGPRVRLFGTATLAFCVIVLIGPSLIDAVSILWRQDRDCRILAVVNAETLRGWCPGEGYVPIRLMGIDAADGQDCEVVSAFAAKQFLRWELWTSRESRTVRSGHDVSGRTIAALVLDGHPLVTTMADAGVVGETATPRGDWCL